MSRSCPGPVLARRKAGAFFLQGRACRAFFLTARPSIQRANEQQNSPAQIRLSPLARVPPVVLVFATSSHPVSRLSSRAARPRRTASRQECRVAGGRQRERQESLEQREL